jgi:hypothetical protein
MDPNTAWWNVRECMGARADLTAARNAANVDHASAYEHASALLGWLGRGGFPPTGFTREAVEAYCRDVVRRTRPYADLS